MGSRWRRADPGTEQHGDLRRIFRLEVGSLGAFKGLLARQLTCSEAFEAILRANALHSKVHRSVEFTSKFTKKTASYRKIEGKEHTLQHRSVQFGSLDWR